MEPTSAGHQLKRQVRAVGSIAAAGAERAYGKLQNKLADRHGGDRMQPTIGELIDTGSYRLHKWLNYVHVYERHLAPFRNLDVVMLEIGVQQGGSARLFRDYLGPRATIVGIDIDPACIERTAGLDRVTVEIGDQSDPAFIAEIAERYGPFDIVLDDGGHTLNQILTSYEVLFDHLRTPGLYLIEDTCCQYWASDRFRDRPGQTWDEFVLALNETLNSDMAREDLFDHWHVPPNERTSDHEMSGRGRLIHSVHLYESMVAIEKNLRPVPHCVLLD